MITRVTKLNMYVYACVYDGRWFVLSQMFIYTCTESMNQQLYEGDALEYTAAAMRHHINTPCEL